MNFEKFMFNQKIESQPTIKLHIEKDFEDFIPEEFKNNPVEYFEQKGNNLKHGEIKKDELGKIKEDPTAVKALPRWTNKEGKQLEVVGKKVNVEKGKVGESGDPFYEYKIMKTVKSLNLPTATPIAKVEQGKEHLIIMEKVPGIGWHERELLKLKEKGYSDEDIQKLIKEAEAKMSDLQKKFEEAGIHREWKLKDMIFDIDIPDKKINKITPVDWERTSVDVDKLNKYREKYAQNIL